MITIGIIRNGGTYLAHHLRKNDYWAEGEKEVRGEWIGEGARALGLAGAVADETFSVLQISLLSRTGSKQLWPLSAATTIEGIQRRGLCVTLSIDMKQNRARPEQGGSRSRSSLVTGWPLIRGR